ncbi:hypothetical protein [Lysobacter silvisoli]|uniref:Uncharacterized protein n=1 Tax=Lysobacter silvisoli TaxID=2293254 RepID=A0A371K3Q5_9GAMM|nr:hypothetical protein [Lysobacter silvisoli]RDZ28504.1 hypothetical protein DX914_05070 [Lysobacter silvisoli]
MFTSPKRFALPVLLGLSLLAPAAAVPAQQPANDVTLAALPPGVQLRELNRYFFNHNNGSGYHFSAFYLPNTWEFYYDKEGTLGFVSMTPFENSRPIYNCLIEVPRKHPSPFTSLDVNCEGQIPNSWHGFTGYLSTVQIEGTVPLYRCRFTRGQPHHFDTHSPNCEGNPNAVSEGVLGYIFL